MRAVLIDDELHSLEILKYELSNTCPEIIIAGSALGGVEGLHLIKTLQPDIVFLDIEMPGLNGFDLLEKLDSIDFMIIFITAFDQYAIKAFKYSAMDYLLKPIKSQDLADTMIRVNLIKNQDSLRLLRSLLEDQKKNSDRIALAVGNDIVFANLAEIVRCKADGNYTNVFLTNGETIYVSRSIKEITSILEERQFLKCHQSHLVNVSHIQTYSKADGGFLIMGDSTKVPISRANREKVQKALLE